MGRFTMKSNWFVQPARGAQSLASLVLALALLVTGMLQAHAGSEVHRSGYVMARSVVLDENEQPILVEYDNLGNEVRELPLPEGYSDDIASLVIMAANTYQGHLDRLQTYKQQHGNDLAMAADLMTVAQFKSQPFKAADNTTVIPHPDLAESVKSLYVRGQSDRLTDDPNDLVLLTFPVDLTEPGLILPADKSVVLTPEGKLIAKSTHNIAYRVGFFGDPASPQTPLGEMRVKEGDTIFGPVVGTKVNIDEFAYPGGVTSSDAEGRFSLRGRLPTCPIGGFEFTVDIYAQLNYNNFMPIGSPQIPYYLRRQSWENCYAYLGAGYAYISAPNTLNYGYQHNFYVDVMVVTGKVSLKNLDDSPVPIGDATTYSYFDEEELAITQNRYDFNVDGKPDILVKGTLKTITDPATQAQVQAFIAEGQTPHWQAGDVATLQGVYFEAPDTSDGATPAPDLVRLMDSKKRTDQKIGLLQSISAEDFRNTDILMFRESTGQLVTARTGLTSGEVNGRLSVGLNQDEEQVAYRVLLRGRKDSHLNIGGGARTPDYTAWATANKMAEPFQQRDADHLKPGEFVKVVAINRATGYVGTARVELKFEEGVPGITVEAPEIAMAPPNLKIWAERVYDVEKGITQGEERNYLIGSEGASLTSDTYIQIYTEWLDRDGSALPDQLNLDNGEQYGLSGRFAKVVADSTLAETGDQAIFPIPPGLKTQVVKAGDNLTTAEHFYIHVSGTPKDNSPNFDAGDLEPPYDARPNKLTPFMVPLFDEDKHWQTYNEYRRLQKEFDAGTPNTIDPEKPLPTYAWNYRPEYQFSQFDLEMQAINRVENAGTAEENKTNILDLSTPTISNTDDLIELLYSLIGSDFDRLTPIDGKQELILALGEDETLITLGENQTIHFSNLGHLASLAPEDYLTMRLYTNNDAGNILWEYAFETLILETQLAGYDAGSGEPLYISADEPTVPLQAFVLGYANRDPTTKQPLIVTWAATSGAALSVGTEENRELGVFFNEVTLPPVAGFTTDISVNLLNSTSAKATLPPIIVVPGAPSQVTYTEDGNLLSIDGVSERTYTFTVKDKNGNLISDGTGVSFVAGDSLQVASYDDATTNGIAHVTIKGGSYAGDADLTFKVGQVETKVDLDIKPLNITVVMDATIFPGASDTVTVSVTDQNGAPVANAEVLMGSSYGFIKQTELTTDANGQATTTYTAPDSDGTGEITAQVGRSPLGRTNIEVVYPSMEDRDLEVDNASMVGDIGTASAITHTRYDGTDIQLAARAQDTIQAIGHQGDNVTITIGDIRDPNLSPVAAYYMNDVYEDVVQDDTGRYHLQASGVTKAAGSAMGAGFSLKFQTDGDPATEGDQASKLFTDGLTLLQQAQNIGFSIEVLPLGGSTGTLVNLGQGAQTLAFNQYGQLEYQIQTSTGTYSVQTNNAIMPGSWQKVAARYHNNQIELFVNGTTYTAPASGNLSHTLTGHTQLADIADPAKNHDLVVGEGFGGQIRSLKWYNWNGQPVMTFADGSTSKTVVLPAPTDGTSFARQDLAVKSTGRLRENGSQLGLLRIAIHTNKVRQYASLLSTDTFTTIAGQYVDTLATDTPPINVAGLTPQTDLLGNPVWPQPASNSLLISNAYAAEESSLAWDIFNFIIPLESVGVLIEQLQYAVTDPEKFDAAEFTIALVDTITILPLAKPLKAFTRPLKAMTKFLKPLNPKFTKHFAGAFGKLFGKIRKGDTDTLLNLLPFLVTAAEMYSDEESRKGLEFLIKTVASPDDILAWIDYLALPADGWEGTGPPPKVSAFPQEETTASIVPFNIMINDAHAAGTSVVFSKIVSKTLGKSLLKVASRVTKKEIKDLPTAIREIRKHLDDLDAADFRKRVFNADALKSATWVFGTAGARSLKNFITGKANARYSQAMIAGTVAYLGWESACGIAQEPAKPNAPPPQDGEVIVTAEDLGCGDKNGFNEQVRGQLALKLATVFADAATKDLEEEPLSENRYTIGKGHGALFHLVQTAYFQLQYRFAGGQPIKGLEKSRYVAWFVNEDSIPEQNAELICGKASGCYDKKLRYVDIVLGEDGVDKPERWIELKSYAARGITTPNRYKLQIETKKKPLGRWDFTTTSTNSTGLHQQFSLDRAAFKLGVSWLTPEETKIKGIRTQQIVGDFNWRWQAFDIKTKKTNKRVVSPLMGSPTVNGSIRWLLSKRPEGKGIGKVDESKIQETSFGGDDGMANKIQLATGKAVLQDLIKNGFDIAKDEIIPDVEMD